MNGIDLDKEMRKILMAATRDNVLASAKALVDLGFPGVAALHMVSDIILAKEKQ